MCNLPFIFNREIKLKLSTYVTNLFLLGVLHFQMNFLIYLSIYIYIERERILSLISYTISENNNIYAYFNIIFIDRKVFNILSPQIKCNPTRILKNNKINKKLL